MTMPLVSVIVLNYNGLRWLEPCFDALLASDYPRLEILMADNASTDGSQELVKARYPMVRIVQLTENRGYTGANNVAAQQATGDYILFLNNDTKIAPDAIRRLVEASQAATVATLFACEQRSYDGSTLLNAGLATDPFAAPYPSDGDPVYADGAALFLPRDAFERLGGFDDDYFIFNEDLDLGWRALLAGYDVKAAHGAVVLHEAGGTVGGSVRKETRYRTSVWRRFQGERNSLQTMLKNWSVPVLLWTLPCAFAIGLAESTFLLLIGQWKAAAVNPRALGWNIRRLPLVLRKRRRVQAMRRVPDRAILRRMRMRSSKITVALRYGVPRYG